MKLSEIQQQQLIDIANEMATELQCYLLDTVTDGPGSRYTQQLINKHKTLKDSIKKTEEPTP